MNNLMNKFNLIGSVFFSVALLLMTSAVVQESIAQDNGEPMVNPGSYPAPRYPSFLENATKEQLLAAARVAVRQTEGYSTLGVAERGQTVHVFTMYNQDMDVWEAIKEAWAERGVTGILVQGWEILEMSKEEYEKRAKENLLTGESGWKEFALFEPDYLKFLSPEAQKEMGNPLATRWIADNEKKYGQRPEIEYIFVGEGGGGRRVAQHGKKFLGNWIYASKGDLMAKDVYFPSDIWKMVDETIVRPIPHVSEGTFHDPQGTRLRWNQTPQQSQLWDKESGLTSYSSGHLTIYPPPQQATWTEGVIVANANHTAFYPEMTARIDEKGKLTEVTGGGKAGDMFRMLQENPLLKDAHFPSYSEPGYWYLMQDGMGTNPKTVRNMGKLVQGSVEKPNLIERRRAGIQHFSFSSPIGDSSFGGMDMNDPDFIYAQERGIPIKHTSHMHVYFGTLKWKLRDTGEWITIMDKGWVTAFDNPEVRALASKYGNPDVIFSYDWVPAIPGVNVEGDYQKDFARDPWAWLTSEWESIKNGTYKYFVNDYEMFRNPSVGSR